MSDKPDTLKLLKTRYLVNITEMEKNLEALKEKVRVIDELQADAEGLTNNSVGNGSLKYAGGKFTLIDAAYDAMKNIGASGVIAPTVARYLKDNGFLPKGKNFNVTVGISLNRLADKGKIKSEREHGNRVFTLKP